MNTKKTSSLVAFSCLVAASTGQAQPKVLPLGATASMLLSAPRKKAKPKVKARLSAQQKSAAQRAVRALRKMESAIDIGLNYASYTERVVDTMASVDEEIESLPGGSVKTGLEAASRAYKDAAKVWGVALQEEYITIYIERTRPILTKYGIIDAWKKNGGLPASGARWDEPGRLHRNGFYRESAIKLIWLLAASHTEAASKEIR